MRRVDLAVSLPAGSMSSGNQLYPPDQLHRILELARMADDAGVTTVLTPDHVVMSSRIDRYGWGPFPDTIDSPWLEPLTLLAAIAGATSRVRLGTSILIAPLRPATLLAKTAATIDVLSRGRLELGVAVGWQEEEYQAEGIDFSARGQILTDTMAACRALWGPSPSSFSSATVAFENIWCEPKPVQAGGPPILFAGTLTSRNADRIVAMGDGWIPIMRAGLEQIGDGIRVLRERFTEAGRDPDSIKVRAPLPVVTGGDGNPDLAATIEGAAAFVEAGVSEVTVRIPPFVADAADAGGWFTELGRTWSAFAGDQATR
jgi:probable F420-dependent oxidoreductase